VHDLDREPWLVRRDRRRVWEVHQASLDVQAAPTARKYAPSATAAKRRANALTRLRIGDARRFDTIRELLKRRAI
jgi:hypothetical protein